MIEQAPRQKKRTLGHLGNGKLAKISFKLLGAEGDIATSTINKAAREIDLFSSVPKKVTREIWQQFSPVHEIVLAKAKRSLGGTIGDLTRKGHLEAMHVNADGTFNTEKLSESDYFKGKTDLVDALGKHQLSKKSKLLAASKAPKSVSEPLVASPSDKAPEIDVPPAENLFEELWGKAQDARIAERDRLSAENITASVPDEASAEPQALLESASAEASENDESVAVFPSDSEERDDRRNTRLKKKQVRKQNRRKRREILGSFAKAAGVAAGAVVLTTAGDRTPESANAIPTTPTSSPDTTNNHYNTTAPTSRPSTTNNPHHTIATTTPTTHHRPSTTEAPAPTTTKVTLVPPTTEKPPRTIVIITTTSTPEEEEGTTTSSSTSTSTSTSTSSSSSTSSTSSTSTTSTTVAPPREEIPLPEEIIVPSPPVTPAPVAPQPAPAPEGRLAFTGPGDLTRNAAIAGAATLISGLGFLRLGRSEAKRLDRANRAEDRRIRKAGKRMRRQREEAQRQRDKNLKIQV